jgi:hypothetical protein
VSDQTPAPRQSRDARYAQWGRGKYHVVPDGTRTTVCGKPVPEDARTTIYRPLTCALCVRKDPAMAEAAEAARQALYARQSERYEQALDRDRRGEFVVHRCKVCGRQCSTPVVQANGTQICALPGQPFHETQPEELILQGPAWERSVAA